MCVLERLETEIGASDIGRFKYKLVRTNTNDVDGKSHNENLLESQLLEGDSIVVSTERQHYALAIGFVIELSRDHLVIAVDRNPLQRLVSC